MSLFSTYNSVSARPWQQTSGIYGLSANLLANNTVGPSDCTYDGTYYISCATGIGTNTIGIFNKTTNNTLVRQYAANNISCTDATIAGSGGVAAIGDGFHSNRLGRIQFYVPGWSIQTTINGNSASNIYRLGQTLSLNGDGTQLITYSIAQEFGANGTIRFYTPNGNSWTNTSNINVSFAFQGIQIRCANQANTFVINGGSGTPGVYIYENGNWSNFAHSNATFCYINSAGNYITAGIPNENKVIIYNKSGNVWSAIGNISIPYVGGAFGLTSTINDTGNRITISAYTDPIAYTTANIYVYEPNPEPLLGNAYNLIDIINPPTQTFGVYSASDANGTYLFTSGFDNITNNNYQYLFIS